MADGRPDATPTARDLSIVVVTWRSAAELPPLLRSLADVVAAGAELIVVDNASGDGTPALVRDAAPAAQVVENASNLGFAAAANQGWRASRGRFVLFLNPDVVVETGAIEAALGHAASDRAIGILGCRTVDAGGELQPTVDRYLGVGALMREALARRRGPAAPPRGESPPVTTDVDWLYGSFLLCRREVLDVTGGFDEAYEMYGEDLDLCHRAHAAGWRIVFFAAATIMHRGASSAARRWGERREVEVLKGTLRFFRRRRGRAHERLFRALAGGAFAAKALANAVHTLAGGGEEARVRARRYGAMAVLCARGDPAAGSDPPSPHAAVHAGDLRAAALRGKR